MTRVIVDDSAHRAFVRLQRQGSVRDSEIEALLGLASFREAIDLMGRNWGIGLHDEWFKLFSFALSEDTRFAETDLSVMQRKYATYLREKFADRRPLAADYSKLLAAGDFVALASQYAPETAALDEVKVILGVFGPNAGGNRHVFLDVPLLTEFSTEAVEQIAAHEYNHILRELVQKVDQPSLPKPVLQSLYWFESEGIADLCNFEVNYQLYSLLGYAAPSDLERLMGDMEHVIRETSHAMKSCLEGTLDAKSYYAFMTENIRFHVIAYFMARTLADRDIQIVRNLLGNPYAFFLEYQKVCKSTPGLQKFAFALDVAAWVAARD